MAVALNVAMSQRHHVGAYELLLMMEEPVAFNDKTQMKESTLVVIILAFGSEARGFDPGQGQWIFSERKNPEYHFLRKGSKAMSPVSYIYGT